MAQAPLLATFLELTPVNRFGGPFTIRVRVHAQRPASSPEADELLVGHRVNTLTKSSDVQTQVPDHPFLLSVRQAWRRPSGLMNLIANKCGG
jgi:hypothetical protein